MRPSERGRYTVRYTVRYMGCYTERYSLPLNRPQAVEKIAALHVALHRATPRYATAPPYKGAVAPL